MIARNLITLLALLCVASPLFAQETVATGMATNENFTRAFAVLAMAIASGLCALGQGRAIAGAAEGIARNPGAGAVIRFALILGLVFIESLGLLTFVIILLRSA